MKINDPEKTLQMVSEMLAAIQEAGGAVRSFTWDRLKEMTAAELIETLAPNDVRVKYVSPPKWSEKN